MQPGTAGVFLRFVYVFSSQLFTLFIVLLLSVATAYGSVYSKCPFFDGMLVFYNEVIFTEVVLLSLPLNIPAYIKKILK